MYTTRELVRIGAIAAKTFSFDAESIVVEIVNDFSGVVRREAPRAKTVAEKTAAHVWSPNIVATEVPIMGGGGYEVVSLFYNQASSTLFVLDRDC